MDDPVGRIVCLTEEPTEILYLLGEAERIVGISAYTVRPPQARKEKPVVSAFVDGSVRKICALEPDLVIGFSDIQSKLAAELIRKGLQVLIFNQRSVAEIFGVIRIIGRLVGREERANELVLGFEQRIAGARRRAELLPRRPRVYFEEWDDPMISGIRWVSELIGIVGGDDVFSDLSQQASATGRVVTPARVVARRPEIVLASWCGKPFDRARFEARPGFADLPAVTRGAVYELDPALILQPGPACLGDGLELLERLVHGAVAEAPASER